MQQAMLSTAATKINEKDWGTMEDNPEFYRDEIERVMETLPLTQVKTFTQTYTATLKHFMTMF